MASLRTNPTGTVSVLYRHGDKQASKTFDAPRQAREFKALVEAVGPDRALAAMAEVDPEEQLTVAELAAMWLTWKESRVTDRTMTDYRRDVTNWILPTLGRRAADAIDEADVQKWVDRMAKQLSPKSVADRHMLLHSMYAFGRARSRQLVSHNPCTETELPRKTKKPPKGLTVPEFRAIIDGARRRNEDAADLILFLGETGWRFSEATALDVRDVEDDGHDVWVTVSRVFRIDGQGKQVIAEDAAKAYASFRRIRLWSESAAMVRRRIVGKGPGDLVFTNRLGRHWNQHTFLRETWPRVLESAGLVELEYQDKRPPKIVGDRKPTPHWLRHMNVAVRSASGASLVEIQRAIGHRSPNTTFGTYGGMIGDMGDEARDRADALMAGKRNAPGVAPVVRGEIVND